MVGISHSLGVLQSAHERLANIGTPVPYGPKSFRTSKGYNILLYSVTRGPSKNSHNKSGGVMLLINNIREGSVNLGIVEIVVLVGSLGI
jgi:hypothetical protein